MTMLRLSEAKAFAHGTVRSWKRGTVMKTERAWTRLAREKSLPYQPVPETTPTPYGGDPYSPASPYVADALANIVDKLGEAKDDDYEEKSKVAIMAALKAANKKGGGDALKLAAYELEAGGKVSLKMLASILSDVAHREKLDGEKVSFTSKWGAVTLGMYADDLRRGR